jgi:hypothetical protein
MSYWYHFNVSIAIVQILLCPAIPVKAGLIG